MDYEENNSTNKSGDSEIIRWVHVDSDTISGIKMRRKLRPFEPVVICSLIETQNKYN